jgi:hypothetical protein
MYVTHSLRVNCISAGIEALWAVHSRARITQIDPIMHVVTPASIPS